MEKKEKRKEIYKYLSEVGVKLDTKFGGEYINNSISKLLKEYDKVCSESLIRQLADKDRAIAKLKKQPIKKLTKQIIRKVEPIKKHNLSKVKPSFFIK